MTSPISTSYAASAYRSDSHAPLPPPKWREDANRSGLFDTHLVYGNYANLDPAMEIATQLQDEEQLRYEQQREHGEPEQVYCDAQRWRFQNSSRIPHILFTLKFVAYGIIWFAWGVAISASVLDTGYKNLALFLSIVSVGPLLTSVTLYAAGNKWLHPFLLSSLVVCVGTVLWVSGSLWSGEETQVFFWLGAFCYFMGAIGLDGLIYLHSRLSHHDGSEFNRLDGMLRFKRRFRRLFVAPFEEFDPVLQLLPSGYGGHDYAIWLHHRYTDNKVCLATKVHALGLDQANALAFWDCLQRYMDVTQPLPDLPVLEQSRHLDPVSAAHDATTKRKPRRWRDQTYKGWKSGGSKLLSKQLQQYPWQQQPCIIKARIDPNLSIETYYRGQEARGILATPKGDDFDDVHRG